MTVDTDAISDLIIHTAGEVVVPRWQHLQSGEIDEKQPGDYVTVADRESEKVIGDALTAMAPGCLIVGEEAAFADPAIVDAIPTAPLAYVIDPVDGTRNFVEGRDTFAVMVCETRGGVTTRAWIYQPILGRFYIAEHGAGLWCDGERVQPSLRPGGLPRGRVALRRLWGTDAGGRLAPIEATAGSVGIDYPSLCEGDVDYLAFRKVKPWDHLPGALMVREVGGTTVLPDGTAYDATSVGPSGLVVALTPEVADVVREAIEL